VSELALQNNILLRWGAVPGLRLFRTNAGALRDSDGRLVRYGIVGGPDISGVLAPRGRFLGVECKADRGRQSEQQKSFERMCLALGGVYLLVRTMEEADAGIRNAIAQENALTELLRDVLA
jgi:hypothetical protein